MIEPLVKHTCSGCKYWGERNPFVPSAGIVYIVDVDQVLTAVCQVHKALRRGGANCGAWAVDALVREGMG
jgi:hypothetical protein